MLGESFVEVVDRHGRRRRARKGETLCDGETMRVPMRFVDAQLHDELVEKHRRDDAVGVVDAAGLPAGFRPGYAFDSSNALADAAAEAAYRERVEQLDAKTRKRCRPDDDDDEDDDRDNDLRRETEMERRQRLVRKAAQETRGTDARQMTLDELQARAETAYQERVQRISNAWRTR
jgi:hypothetical protein